MTYSAPSPGRSLASDSSTSDRPRIGVVVVDDGLYTHRWVASLFDARDLDIVAVGRFSPFSAMDFNPGRACGLWRVALARLAYYGPSATLAFAWMGALAKVRDRRFRLGLGGQPWSIASLARARACEAFAPAGANVHDEEFCRRLASHRPDLLVCAFSQRAGPALLDIPRIGCLNVHFSLLPQHRGREPLFHAMLAGAGAGVTVHWMTGEIDAGATVLQEPLDLSRVHTLHEAILRACRVAAELLPRAVRAAMHARPTAAPAHELPAANRWPTREQVAAFRERGLRFA